MTRTLRSTLVVICIVLVQAEMRAQIIYTRQIRNNDDLVLMDEKGQTRVIADHPRKDSSPMVSPDGKMLVFTSERVGWWKIWTMNLETKQTNQLTHESSADYSPAWSPDGKQIVFISSRDGNQEVYVMNKDGSNKVNITKSSTAEVMPYWSPDGYIYYSASIDGVYQLARIRPDGKEKEILTSSPDNKLMPQPSIDGKSILYYGDADGNMEIYLLNTETNLVNRLTNNPLMDIRPRWSPDNSRIVFERGNKRDNHHIYIMNRDGTELKQLTTENYNYSPSFFIYPHN